MPTSISNMPSSVCTLPVSGRVIIIVLEHFNTILCVNQKMNIFAVTGFVFHFFYMYIFYKCWFVNTYMISMSRSTLHGLTTWFKGCEHFCLLLKNLLLVENKQLTALRPLPIFCNMRGMWLVMWLSGNDCPSHFKFQHIYSSGYRTSSVWSE